MFQKARSFNQPLNSWKLESTRFIPSMFRNAKSFNQPLDKWDVSQILHDDIFEGATSFNQPVEDWENGFDLE